MSTIGAYDKVVYAFCLPSDMLLPDICESLHGMAPEQRTFPRAEKWVRMKRHVVYTT